jgi:hypothetical protein
MCLTGAILVGTAVNTKKSRREFHDAPNARNPKDSLRENITHPAPTQFSVMRCSRREEFLFIRHPLFKYLVAGGVLLNTSCCNTQFWGT